MMDFPDSFSFESLDTLRASFGSPLFLYDGAALDAAIEAVRRFPQAYGLFARYAMKANPNRAILERIRAAGLGIDASSVFEVERALRAGFNPDQISLSTQELPEAIGGLLDAGVEVNCCSLSQIETVGRLRPGYRIGLRFNPGAGSGGHRKTNTGGPESSFGIWKDLLPEVKSLVEAHALEVFRIHSHIGSGSDPEVWKEVSQRTLALVHEFPGVTTVNLGGGFKIGRVPGEQTTDLQAIGDPVVGTFRVFAEETGRELRLEIEPGTWLIGRAGYLLATIQDIVETGPEGYRFLKLDAGMTEILRPSLYGSQHAMRVYSRRDSVGEPEPPQPVVVVGHCCESGDLLTCAPGEPDVLQPRELAPAERGDLLVMSGVGAYCSSMSTMNYNSFPAVAEVLIDGGEPRLIRRRQTLDQILANEYQLEG